jgi:hypothetical protein
MTIETTIEMTTTAAADHRALENPGDPTPVLAICIKSKTKKRNISPLDSRDKTERPNNQ